MRFHILGCTFERIPNTTVVRTLTPTDSDGNYSYGRGIDLRDYSYDPMPDDAQVLALTIGLILKGVL